MDGGAWWAAVHGVAKSQTRLSDFTFTFHFHALEKEMVAHSSVLAWRIPGMGEPGGLLSMGSRRVGHDWSDLAAAAEPLLLESYNIFIFVCFIWHYYLESQPWFSKIQKLIAFIAGYSAIRINHNLFIHSLVDGHLDCFPFGLPQIRLLSTFMCKVFM